jgi:hypothetical protein
MSVTEDFIIPVNLVNLICWLIWFPVSKPGISERQGNLGISEPD